MEEVIYTDTLGYPEKRNIAEIPHNGYKVEKRLNPFRLPNAMYFKFYDRSQQFFLNSHFEPFKTRNIHHFFNTISFGKAPWVTTFETLLPRWGNVPAWLERKGVELLADARCKKLIAISECTKIIQSNYLNRFPDLKEEILNKTVVIHPPQEPFIESKEMNNSERLNLLLVGNQICSKGGREAVNVVVRLFKEGVPIQLTIISAMEPDAYASHTTNEDINMLRYFISENSSCIRFLGRQPHSLVKEELLRANLALLPTYADTYGYFVLEAQAAGCPVITTNIRALPEINNGECGWLIEVPKDENGNALLGSVMERVALSSKIENELYKLLMQIVQQPSLTIEKGINALKRIKKDHSLQTTAEKIEAVYKIADFSI